MRISDWSSDVCSSDLALAARYGIPEQAVGRISPGALACLFRTPPEEFRRRAEGDLFLDLWLIQWAYDLGMRVVALERLEIGRAHVCTPVTNAQLVCRLLLVKKNQLEITIHLNRTYNILV